MQRKSRQSLPSWKVHWVKTDLHPLSLNNQFLSYAGCDLFWFPCFHHYFCPKHTMTYAELSPHGMTLSSLTTSIPATVSTTIPSRNLQRWCSLHSRLYIVISYEPGKCWRTGSKFMSCWSESPFPSNMCYIPFLGYPKLNSACIQPSSNISQFSRFRVIVLTRKLGTVHHSEGPANSDSFIALCFADFPSP